jgi:hypothetical protein
VDPFLRHSGFARVLAFVFASLLLVQVAAAGVPLAAGNGVGVLCSTQDAPGGKQPPSVPHPHHHHGLCCILHCGALDAAPLRPQISGELTGFSAATVIAPPVYFAPAPRMAPKGAPQSPRAPPV